MPRVGNHGLGIEHITADALGKGHAEIRVQADPGDADTGILLVRGSEIQIVMVMMAVRVAGMAAGLAGGAHDAGEPDLMARAR